MTDKPTPDDYDADNGYHDGKGVDQCPHCPKIFSHNQGYWGTVYDQQGTEYDDILETDPTDGPFFCADCWDELSTNLRQSEHNTLEEFQ